LWLKYVVGKPTSASNPDEVNLDELRLLAELPGREEFAELMQKVPAPECLSLVASAMPVFWRVLLGQMLAAAEANKDQGPAKEARRLRDDERTREILEVARKK